MNKASTIGMLLGLAVVTALVVWQGVATVGGALASIGWGMLLLLLVFPPHLVLGAISWRLLFEAGRAPPLGTTLYALWIGGSVNWLLPVATIGGELVKARLVMRRGVSGTDATASVVVDKTVQALSVLLWVLIGLGLLLWQRPDASLVVGVFVGLILFAVAVAVFLAMQRAGALGFLSGAIARYSGSAFWHRVAGKADQLDATLRALYDRPGRIIFSVLLRLGARVVLAGEVWLAAYLMGAPIGILEAVILKSLVAAARSAAFTVPGGLGAQEAGFVVFGALIGLAPETMLAISLATRVRELMIGLPALIAWQLSEGRALAGRGRPQPSSD